MTSESVYNLVPPDRVEIAKEPLYKSRHPHNLPPTASTFGLTKASLPGVKNVGGAPSEAPVKKAHAHLGPKLGVSAADPSQPLKRKTQRISSLKEVRAQSPERLAPSKPKTKVKPGLPKEKPLMNLASTKDYVVANAVETILAAARKPNLEDKDYLHKADYGQVPKYLTSIKQDIHKEYETIRKLKEQEEDQAKAKVKLLPEEERRKLIDALKAKWEKVNTDYQATTHMTKLDTIGKIRRKEQYEKQLSEIERDIERLSKGYIFVDQEH